MLSTLAQSCDMTSREYLGDYKKKNRKTFSWCHQKTLNKTCALNGGLDLKRYSIKYKE